MSEASFGASNIDITSGDLEVSGGDLNFLLSTLSEESKTLVKIMNLIITKQFKTEIESLKKEINTRDLKMEEMNKEINNLKEKVKSLENNLDNAEQYERRDTVIFSGPLIPPESRP